MMDYFGLPNDTVEFLRRGGQFEYDPAACECGRVGLKPLGALRLEAVDVEPDDEAADGYYRIPAVSLTGECQAYDPEFILLWLPNERMFGTWDSDHLVLETFEGATWADIVANPAAYLGASWDADSGLTTRFRPEGIYELRSNGGR